MKGRQLLSIGGDVARPTESNADGGRHKVDADLDVGVRGHRTSVLDSARLTREHDVYDRAGLSREGRHRVECFETARIGKPPRREPDTGRGHTCTMPSQPFRSC